MKTKIFPNKNKMLKLKNRAIMPTYNYITYRSVNTAMAAKAKVGVAKKTSAGIAKKAVGVKASFVLKPPLVKQNLALAKAAGGSVKAAIPVIKTGASATKSTPILLKYYGASELSTFLKDGSPVKLLGSNNQTSILSEKTDFLYASTSRIIDNQWIEKLLKLKSNNLDLLSEPCATLATNIAVYQKQIQQIYSLNEHNLAVNIFAKKELLREYIPEKFGQKTEGDFIIDPSVCGKIERSEFPTHLKKALDFVEGKVTSPEALIIDKGKVECFPEKGQTFYEHISFSEMKAFGAEHGSAVVEKYYSIVTDALAFLLQ